MRKGVLKIVVPCYNEEEVLHETNKRLLEVITSMEQSGKIVSGGVVYVDDGSRDTTWQIIDELSKDDSHVSGIKLAHNAGHQNALFAGLTLVSECCDMAVSIDADLQDDTNAIFEMVDKYNEGVEVLAECELTQCTNTEGKNPFKADRLGSSDKEVLCFFIRQSSNFGQKKRKR